MPFLALIKIKLVHFKWVLYVDLFYLSRIFDKRLACKGVPLLCCFLRYNAF